VIVVAGVEVVALPRRVPAHVAVVSPRGPPVGVRALEDAPVVHEAQGVRIVVPVVVVVVIVEVVVAHEVDHTVDLVDRVQIVVEPIGVDVEPVVVAPAVDRMGRRVLTVVVVQSVGGVRGRRRRQQHGQGDEADAEAGEMGMMRQVAHRGLHGGREWLNHRF
jgi:hypothetical protein